MIRLRFLGLKIEEFAQRKCKIIPKEKKGVFPVSERVF